MNRESVFLIGGIVVMTVTFLGFAIASDNSERELIDSGQCEATDREMYHPAPTYQKVGEMMVPITHDPYPRLYWRCEGGQQFWRRE